jgi:hypothetical protein
VAGRLSPFCTAFGPLAGSGRTCSGAFDPAPYDRPATTCRFVCGRTLA